MHTFVGLDFSLSATGWYVIDAKGWRGGVISPPDKMVGVQRLDFLDRSLRATLASELTSGENVAVCIEDCFVSSNGKVTIALAQWQGLARTTLWRAGLGFFVASPITLKQFVTGDTNAKKEHVMLSLFKTWGKEIRDNNEADACGLALIAQAKSGVPIRALSAVQKKSVERVFWQNGKDFFGDVKLSLAALAGFSGVK